MNISLSEGEAMVKEGPANHFKGLEGVGGWLFLTNRRLVSKSHRFNVQRHEESYPLEEIKLVQPRNTLWLIPNGLLVTMRAGRQEKFVVSGRGEWITRIKQTKEQQRAT